MCEGGEVLIGLPIWFVLLWVGGLLLAVVTRSLLLSVGMIMLSAMGTQYCVGIEGVSDVIRYGMVGMMVLVCGYFGLVIVFQVRSL